jgi:competence protein ComEA
MDSYRKGLITLALALALILAPGILMAQKAFTGATKVNINTAPVESLQALPGIGPSIAQRIVDYRTAHGPFEKVEDLTKVQGIGEKKLEAIKPFVEVKTPKH